MKKIFTIPNILSIVRILLIPVFIVLYLIGRQGENIYLMISVAVVALSGFTDILDGIIARKCNMVSDLGKVLDPVADKLTQAAVAICLAIDNPIVIPMFVVFAVKESAMMIGALTLYKSTERRPISAKWYGKMSTVILYAVMMLIIIYTGMDNNSIGYNSNAFNHIFGNKLLFTVQDHNTRRKIRIPFPK